MPAMTHGREAGARRAFLGSEPLLFAALVVVVGGLAIVPLARLALEGVAPGGRLDWTVLTGVLAARATWIATAHTIVTALLGTVLAVGLGVPAALVVALTDIRGKSALVFAFMLPLLIPPQIIAVAWIELLGPASPVLRPLGLAPPSGAPHPLYGAGGVSLLLGIEHAPLVFLTLNAGLRNLPRELIEAAQASGAGAWRVLRTVIVPLARPALIAGAALAFVSAIGNFGTPALLGIPGGYTVLTTLIYQKLAGFGPRVLGEVADLSLLLGVIAASGFLVQGWVTRRRDAAALSSGRLAEAFALGRRRLAVEALSWTVVLLVVAMPLAALVAISLVSAYGVPLRLATLTARTTATSSSSTPPRHAPRATACCCPPAPRSFSPALAVPLGFFIAWRGNRVMRPSASPPSCPMPCPASSSRSPASWFSSGRCRCSACRSTTRSGSSSWPISRRFSPWPCGPSRRATASSTARSRRRRRCRAQPCPAPHHHRSAAAGAGRGGRGDPGLSHRAQRAHPQRSCCGRRATRRWGSSSSASSKAATTSRLRRLRY